MEVTQILHNSKGHDTQYFVDAINFEKWNTNKEAGIREAYMQQHCSSFNFIPLFISATLTKKYHILKMERVSGEVLANILGYDLPKAYVISELQRSINALKAMGLRHGSLSEHHIMFSKITGELHLIDLSHMYIGQDDGDDKALAQIIAYIEGI